MSGPDSSPASMKSTPFLDSFVSICIYDLPCNHYGFSALQISLRGV